MRIGGRAIGLVMAFLSGCHSFGPDGLRGTHPLYNEAINASMNEQFVQNLVRLHYRDPTYFLDVSNVAATLKLEMGGGLDQSAIGLSGSASDILQFSANGAYSTQPTISYTPMQGEGFVKSVLSPLTLESVIALAGSGWNIRRVFGLCIERINGLENAPTASGPTPDVAPQHDHGFRRLMHLVESLRAEQLLVPLLVPRVDPATKEPQIEIRSVPEHADAVREIKQLLELDLQRDVYWLSGDFQHPDGSTVSIRTRSLMSIFFLLSHHVDTPRAHKDAGLVTVTHDRRGAEFDWGQTLGGKLMHIRYSEDRPGMAFLAIPYRGHWFYIADNDLESKSTFMLLTQLFRLQAGAAKSVAPALTIPLR